MNELTPAEIATAHLAALIPNENRELRGPKLPQQRRRSKSRRDRARQRRAKR